MTNEKRLIDANALMDEFRRYMVERYDREKCVSEENCKTCETGCLWRKKVCAAPTVDAVPVVRCRDCKHCLRHTVPLGAYGYCNHFGYYDYAPEVQADDFCSYGERREG